MSVLDEGCTPKMSFKIAGGVPASRSESPWMTAIYNRLKIFLCGGTLITKNYVLTAAHCIIDQTALYVRLGVKDTFCFKGQCLDSNWNDVVKATIHYDFDPTTMLNDIGVLILKKEVKFNARIWPICIMLDDKINSSGFMTYSAFGWGSTHPNNTESSPILNSITLERKNTWHCLEMDEVWEFSDKLICAGNIKGDTCKGDSGGPLVVYGKYFGKQVAVQAGIVSYGSPSCNKNGAYTDVMAYKDWIRAKTQPTTHIQELLYKECGSSWTGGIDVLHFEVFVMNRNFTGSLITDRK
ncbi:uncharacterized protein Dere_GG27164 [Drosophila erecta]|uniref:Peptidase S1 domain-containing protein n=1 Tax=Drosophila erecta TaxID=7220 RepID=A0A0Q5VWB4_DROER|nr:uncharacterized protein Dere_GG27164 [Drosophila erecta]